MHCKKPPRIPRNQAKQSKSNKFDGSALNLERSRFALIIFQILFYFKTALKPTQTFTCQDSPLVEHSFQFSVVYQSGKHAKNSFLYFHLHLLVHTHKPVYI